MCDDWSVFQALSKDWISQNRHIKTNITSQYFVRQLIVPGHYSTIRIVKLCPLFIIITHTYNLTSYKKKPKYLRQYLSPNSRNAGKSCMLASQINSDRTRAKHRFEWCGNDMNDFYHQYNTNTNVWHTFCRVK